jgi:hypothetical protein
VVKFATNAVPEVLGLVSVEVSRGVAEQPVHDELVVGVEAVDDRVECKGGLSRVYDHLKIGVADLGKEHVHAGTLLKPPAVFMLKVNVTSTRAGFTN